MKNKIQYSNDKVTPMIARMLRIPEGHIKDWEITSQREHAGLIRNSLKVDAFIDYANTLKLQYFFLGRTGLGSWCVDQLQSGMFDPRGLEVINARIVLLYGKETQHIFKALYQTMTVRGPQKG